jgi:cytochrome c oxidase subunit 4
MSEHQGSRIYIVVWIWLLALTAVEVFLGYKHLPLMTMLVLLLGLSIVKAALIIAYFMHLRFEKTSMAWTLMPPLVICIVLMIVFSFPDGIRLLDMRRG